MLVNGGFFFEIMVDNGSIYVGGVITRCIPTVSPFMLSQMNRCLFIQS